MVCTRQSADAGAAGAARNNLGNDNASPATSGGQGHAGPADDATAKEKQLHAGAAKENLELRIGMEFDDDEQAYSFYNEYARRLGFSVRKQNMRRNTSGDVRLRRFVCGKEGYYKSNPSDKDGKYLRTDGRTGCNAHIGIKRVKSGKFCVHRFVPEHNHKLAPSTKVHLLRSQRKYNNDPETLRAQAVAQLEAHEAGGSGNAIPFAPSDCKSYLYGLRQLEMKVGDAGAMMHYLQKKATEDPGFYFALQLDAKDQITNLFWCDARSQIDYCCFGEVVCFDSSYKINGYDRPLVLFTGVNHHKQTIIFGSAFLYNDSVETFRWLFENLRKAMHERTPDLLLTDQNDAIIKAAEEAWPSTTHRLCVWHMYQNAAKNLSSVFQSSPGFEIELQKCFYECECEDEFLSAWQRMLEEYNLTDNTWLTRLFEDREKWALVHRREMFSADMHNTQRTEHMHAVLKAHLKYECDLLSFFHHYDRIVNDQRYSELEADYCARQSTTLLLSRLLKQAASVYTPRIYKLVEKQFELYVDCVINSCGFDERNYIYEVRNVEKRRTSCVTYMPSNDTLRCSCKKLEYVGILCSHILKVLDYKNIKEIPEKYILKRWTKNAKVGINVDYYDGSDEIDPTIAMENRYSSLGCAFQQIIVKGSQCQEAYNVAMKEATKLMEKLDLALQNRAYDNHFDPSQDGSEHHGEEIRVRRRRKRRKVAADGTSTVPKKDKQNGPRGTKSSKRTNVERNGTQGEGQCHNASPTSRTGMPTTLEPHLEDSSNQYNTWTTAGYLSLQFPTMSQTGTWFD